MAQCEVIVGLNSSTCLLLAGLAVGFPAMASAQANPASPGSPRETMQDFVAHLDPHQKQQFDDARTAYQARKYNDSLAIFRQMLKDLPQDAILLKFASESALNAGETGFALQTLKPIAQADPDDWQAVGMLTRACAESGDMPCRNAGMEHMLDLRKRSLTPPNMQDYVVERVKSGQNSLSIRTSLVPWGVYKVYADGQLFDKDGNLQMQITLESNDIDQIGFAREHPEDAKKGVRRFSIDTYRETTDSAGRRTQTQGLVKFIDGQPSYDTIRQEFIKLAAGQAVPGGTQSGLSVPPG